MKYEKPKSLQLEWKECGVDLGLAIEHIKSLSDKVKSYTGYKELTLWLKESLSEQEISDIKSYWDSLSPEHDHCKNYKDKAARKEEQESRESMIKQAKLAMVSKTWANMNVAQRKLCMGLDEEVSTQDLQDLVAE